MRKVILVSFGLFLTACSQSPMQQSTVPLDMTAVQEYQQRVNSGNTISTKKQNDSQALNQSDTRPKVIYRPVYQPVYVPSIGFGYGYYPHHW